MKYKIKNGGMVLTAMKPDGGTNWKLEPCVPLLVDLETAKDLAERFGAKYEKVPSSC